ncbi:MAG: DUF4286 family protein [Phycisphaerae bacterium]|jgi:hypothetical protein
MAPDEPRAGDEALVYWVTATLPDAEVAGEYLTWLEAGHLAEVVRGGARSAELIILDSEGMGDTRIRVVSRYVFSDRAAFAEYERTHAPRLRAEGVARFGPSRGERAVQFARSVGARRLMLASP